MYSVLQVPDMELLNYILVQEISVTLHCRKKVYQLVETDFHRIISIFQHYVKAI